MKINLAKNQARLKEVVSLEKHVLLKKLRDALEALRGRVVGQNKDDVEEAIAMVSNPFSVYTKLLQSSLPIDSSSDLVISVLMLHLCMFYSNTLLVFLAGLINLELFQSSCLNENFVMH